MSNLDHQNPVRECRTVGLLAARRMIEAALDHAQELNCLVSVVVLDAGGNVSALARQDTVAAAVTTVAHNKANTALALRQPTDEFARAVQSNQVLVTSLCAQPGFALLAGGLPLIEDGEVVGAVGVSGARDGKDLDIAMAAAKALHA
ncbi:heme-binding protein [Streptomyces sp. NPDC046985]|uniref:GlcG/HbpS family heme-binding protein n=1 Tax=Streptomyces sp. NPDC046985 TaxID=3155377 RepID=UPI0033E2CD08